MPFPDVTQWLSDLLNLPSSKSFRTAQLGLTLDGGKTSPIEFRHLKHMQPGVSRSRRCYGPAARPASFAEYFRFSREDSRAPRDRYFFLRRTADVSGALWPELDAADVHRNSEQGEFLSWTIWGLAQPAIPQFSVTFQGITPFLTRNPDVAITSPGIRVSA